MKGIGRLRTRRCASAFWMWLKQVQDSIQMRRRISMAYKFRTLLLLSTCLGNWRLGVRISKRKQHLKRLALGFWAHRRLCIAWKAFMVFLYGRHATLTLSEKRRKRLIAFLFQWWHNATVRRLHVSQIHASCLCNKLLKRSFTTLQHHVLWKKNYQEKREKALRFYHDRCIHYACKVWHDYVAIEHVKRRLNAAAETHYRRKLMCFSFNFWRRYVQTKKKKDSTIAGYERKLCVRCMKTWKDHKPEQNATNSTLRHSQDDCNLTNIIRLLKLLRPQSAFVLKWKSRKLLKMKRVNRVICYQARSFCSKLFQEFKRAVRTNFRKSKKEIRMLNSTTISNLQKHETSFQRYAETDSDMITAYSKRTECQNKPIAATDMCSTSAPRHSDRETQDNKETNPSSARRHSIADNKVTSRNRAQPRRPKYLMESLNLDNLRKACHISDFTIFESQLPSLESRKKNKNTLPNHVEICYSNISMDSCMEQKLIKEELLWTDDLLCSFSKSKEELFLKEAQLSALREIPDSAIGQRAINEEIKYLEHKIRALHQRQSILLPFIQELTKRAAVLQGNLGNLY